MNHLLFISNSEQNKNIFIIIKTKFQYKSAPIANYKYFTENSTGNNALIQYYLVLLQNYNEIHTIIRIFHSLFQLHYNYLYTIITFFCFKICSL